MVNDNWIAFRNPVYIINNQGPFLRDSNSVSQIPRVGVHKEVSGTKTPCRFRLFWFRGIFLLGYQKAGLLEIYLHKSTCLLKMDHFDLSSSNHQFSADMLVFDSFHKKSRLICFTHVFYLGFSRQAGLFSTVLFWKVEYSTQL